MKGLESLISVVVPVYNVPEQYLRNCLKSICNQTIENIEVIVVDDGSTDQSGAICDEFARKDRRIKVIHKENGGLSAARNTGYENAKSEWIMFVDGDDWIDAEMCQCMQEIGARTGTQLVMCGMVKEYSNSSEPYKYNLKEGKIYKGQECKWLQEQLLHYNSNIAVAYCKLISRDLLEKYNIKHDAQLRQGAEGLEFNLRLFEKLDSAVFINKPFYHYIYNENSISSLHNEANHEFVVKCFEKIKKQINSSDNRENLTYWFNNRLLYVIITTAISGYFSPVNKETFHIKKIKYKTYLNHEIVKNALCSGNEQGLSKSRKITLFFIKRNMFEIVAVIAYLRNWQKKHN